MTVALIDDQALGLVLRGSVPRSLRRRELATTGCWYVRLCQAALGTVDQAGRLSQPFNDLPPEVRERAIAAVLGLPDRIELLSLRQLGPSIGWLRQRHSLNLIGIEALAAAIDLDAEVFLSAPSPRLEAALTMENCGSRLLV